MRIAAATYGLWLGAFTVAASAAGLPTIVRPSGWACSTVSSATVAHGSGYQAGVYHVSLTGGTGSGASVKAIVGKDGNVFDVALETYGQNFTVGDVLNAALPGGSGFAVTVTSIRDVPLDDSMQGEKIIPGSDLRKNFSTNPCKHPLPR